LQAGRDLLVRTPQGALSLGSAVAAGGDMLLEGASGIIAAAADVTAGGALRLATDGALLLVGGDLRAGGDLAAWAGSTLAVEGTPLTAGATLRLSAGGGLTLTGGSLTSTGGDVRLEGTSTLGITATTLTAARDLNLASANGSVTLRQVAARANGGALGLTAAAEVTLRDSALSAAQDVKIEAGGGLLLNPTLLEAGEDLALTSGSNMDISDRALRAGGALRLVAGGAMRLDGVSLTARTAPADTPDAFRPLRLQAGSRLAVTNGSLAADRAELVAGDTLTTGGSRFTIGTALLLAAAGGIGQPAEAASSVTPIDPGRLPLVIYDTRRGVALARLPDAMTPATTDRPGIGNAEQAWQVPGAFARGRLVFGVNDGVPALPGSGAAGAVLLNLDIGRSPLFMLLDGGTVTGRLDAGRIGVFGRPGEARGPTGRQFDVQGRLSGIEGVAAARFGALSGPVLGFEPAPGDLSQYRFNDCVLSTVNCVAPVTFTLPSVPQVNTLVLTNERSRLDDSDVLLPNIADEDY
jgi:hypothetical protein